MEPNFRPVFIMAAVGAALMPLAIWKLVEIVIWLLS